LAFLFILSATQIRTEIGFLFSGQTTSQRIVEDLNRLFGRYIRALLLLSLAAFTAYALFLLGVGAPYALLLAAVAAVLEFVPVFGPLLSAVIIIAVAGLAEYPHVLWILVFIVGYRVFQDYFLAPRLMGAEAGLHPILILFGLLAGEEVAGVAGIFLSVPVMAATMIISRHLISDRAATRREK
jgi:predicted PurR-regulated permease PerM